MSAYAPTAALAAKQRTVVVHSRLRAGAMNLRAGNIVSVVDGGHGGTKLVLRGVRPPKLDTAVVVPVLARVAPLGVLGMVTSSRRGPHGDVVVSTRPARVWQVYSKLRVSVSGSLGEFLGAHASSTSHAAATDCGKSMSPVSGDIDLSKVDYQFNLDVVNDFLYFRLWGTPEVTLNIGLARALACSITYTDIKVPLGATGLTLSMGPQLSLNASGAFGAHATWSPSFEYGFLRQRGGPSINNHRFKSGGDISFSGEAALSLGIFWETEISVGEGDAAELAIKGPIGIQLTGKAEINAATSQRCLAVDAEAEAALAAKADVLFKNWEYEIGSIKWGHVPLGKWCSPPKPPCTSSAGSNRSGCLGGSGGPGPSEPGSSGGGGGGSGGGEGGSGGGEGGGGKSSAKYPTSVTVVIDAHSSVIKPPSVYEVINPAYEVDVTLVLRPWYDVVPGSGHFGGETTTECSDQATECRYDLTNAHGVLYGVMGHGGVEPEGTPCTVSFEEMFLSELVDDWASLGEIYLRPGAAGLVAEGQFQTTDAWNPLLEYGEGCTAGAFLATPPGTPEVATGTSTSLWPLGLHDYELEDPFTPDAEITWTW